ncbi:MAG: helix-turn-helix domain-containing protein [bacterium]
MNTLNENTRLKEIRKRLGFTQKEFSNNIGIKQGSYSDIERGKVGISSNLMRNLVIKYRINPTWLYEGRGKQFLEEDIQKSITGVLEEEPIYHNHAITRTCQRCNEMEKLIEAHIQTIETQKEYINSLKMLIDHLKKEDQGK